MKMDRSVLTALSLVAYDRPRRADAIVVLTGDGLHRADEGARLFHEGLAPRVVVSGNIENSKKGSLAASAFVRRLRLRKVPARVIIAETTARHTREQALEVLTMAAREKWRRLNLVASPYHQLRAFLTFLKVIEDRKLKISLFNAPVRDSNWFEREFDASRVKLLDDEFDKIVAYAAHVARPAKAPRYFLWRDRREARR